MREPRDPWLRFAVVVVGTALALRIAWALLRPLLPVLAVVVAAIALWRWWRWRRERW